jgi:hypothetical protein
VVGEQDAGEQVQQEALRFIVLLQGFGVVQQPAHDVLPEEFGDVFVAVVGEDDVHYE